MRVLVTGATGFIGSYLIPTLVDRGHDVVATDICDEPQWITDNENIHFIPADLNQNSDIDTLVSAAKPDKVVHLAGLLVAPCESDPRQGFRINVMSTLALLEASVAHGIKRFVMASSPSVFGRNLPEPVADDAIKLPETIYGQTKLACEHILDWYRRTRKLSVGAVRFPWVYGPGRTTGLTAEYSSFHLDTIARGEDLIVRNSEEVGDWLYVKDAIKSLILLLECDDNPTVTYNIMSGVYSVGEVMSIAQKLFPEARIEILKTPRSPYPYASAFDDSLAREEIGWSPDYSIERGIKEHIETVRQTMEAAQ